MEKESTTDKLTPYIDEFGRQQYRYGPPPVELPTDPEWEAYKQMMEEEENVDHELSVKQPTPRHCPIPRDDC